MVWLVFIAWARSISTKKGTTRHIISMEQIISTRSHIEQRQGEVSPSTFTSQLFSSSPIVYSNSSSFNCRARRRIPTCSASSSQNILDSPLSNNFLPRRRVLLHTTLREGTKNRPGVQGSFKVAVNWPKVSKTLKEISRFSVGFSSPSLFVLA